MIHFNISQLLSSEYQEGRTCKIVAKYLHNGTEEACHKTNSGNDICLSNFERRYYGKYLGDRDKKRRII
jgi:hypothetical protein